MTTANLNLPEIAESQSSKYLTHNEALAILDGAVAGLFTKNMASDADYTLATTGTPPYEWQRAAVKVTDTGPVLTTGRNIIVPAEAKPYIFINATAQTLTLKTPAGSGIGVATGKTALLYCDGTNVVRVTADA